ncbi:hypothetical protein BC828DRAFT_357915 [Blastocladiella britannica]|nr:hypothetical protein BC828DRAFT_357915 [Blastocladiella britannica]
MIIKIAAVLLALAQLATSASTTSALAGGVPFTLRQTLDGADVIAFADVNGDKHTDVFTLDSTRRQLSFYLWDTAKKSWSTSTPVFSADALYNTDASGITIVNVVPGDFNDDGVLDLLVSTVNGTSASLDHVLHLALGATTNGPPSFAVHPVPVAVLDSAQPTLAGLSGSMLPDILGVSKGSSSNTNSSGMAVWTAAPRTTAGYATAPVRLPDTMCAPLAGHSNAFVDLDGDCSPDLFLTCAPVGNNTTATYQIWTPTAARAMGNASALGLSRWELARTGLLPVGVGHITFADMDADGTLDAVMTVCDSAAAVPGTVQVPCSIQIVYNRQIPACTTDTTSTCRPLDGLCARDPQFKLDFSRPVVLPATELLASVGGNALWNAGDLGMVRAGDLNLDGYPDLLLVSNGMVWLLQSAPCSGPGASCWTDTSRGSRTFAALAKTGIPKLADLVDAAWFDLDENGTLDILVRRADTAGAVHTDFYENKLPIDAFFLKALATGTGCTHGCQVSPVTALGSSFKLAVTDPKGSKTAIQLSQAFQTAHIPLQLPYAFTGLGRTNNYIDQLSVGVARDTGGSESAIGTFLGIVPNSHVVVRPPPLETKKDSNTTRTSFGGPWRLELSINPSQYAADVLIVLLSTVAVLAAVIGVLQWLENAADERDKSFYI